MPQAAGQTAKKSKVQDGDQSEAIMDMISMASADSTLAGLMSLSAPTSGSSMDDSADDHSAAPSSQHWDPPAKEQPTTNELHAPAKLSLSEYRVKHADELAAQKRKLENMEASVKQGYATATQALMNQQRKEKHHHHQQSSSSSSDLNKPPHIVLKIPLDERSERSSIKKASQCQANQAAGGTAAVAAVEDPSMTLKCGSEFRKGEVGLEKTGKVARSTESGPTTIIITITTITPPLPPPARLPHHKNTQVLPVRQEVAKRSQVILCEQVLHNPHQEKGPTCRILLEIPRKLANRPETRFSCRRFPECPPTRWVRGLTSFPR